MTPNISQQHSNMTTVGTEPGPCQSEIHKKALLPFRQECRI